MREADIAFGMHLCAQAGWNQLEADWRRMLALAPDAGFVAEVESQPVGTAIAVTFDHVVWISMVLVDRARRGQGIGTSIMAHVLAHLDAPRTPAPPLSIRLDATHLGEPIYRKLGFIDQFSLIRLHRPQAGPGHTPPAPVQRAAGLQLAPVSHDDLPTLIALDQRVTQTDRRALLERLVAEHPQWAWLARHEDADPDTPAGYLLMRPGAAAVQIGPGIAEDPRTAEALIAVALAQLHDQAALIDVPAQHTALIDWLTAHGFEEQRRYTRMTRGPLIHEHTGHLLASSGPEKG